MERSAATGERLLEAVLAEPDRDDVRLVYADWLLEQGGALARRGEYVRAALDPGAAALADQGAIEAAIADECLAGFARTPGSHELRFERGFPVHVKAGLRTLVRDGAALFARAPIQSVAVDPVPFDLLGELGDLLALPLSRIRCLSIRGYPTVPTGRLGPEGARALASCPRLGELRELDLWVHEIGDEGLDALLQRWSLTSLALARGALGPAGLSALCASPSASTLEALNLEGNKPGKGGVKALGRAAFPRLERLVLRSCGLDDKDAATLAGASGLGRLRWLDVSDNKKLGAAGKGALQARYGDALYAR